MKLDRIWTVLAAIVAAWVLGRSTGIPGGGWLAGEALKPVTVRPQTVRPQTVQPQMVQPEPLPHCEPPPVQVLDEAAFRRPGDARGARQRSVAHAWPINSRPVDRSPGIRSEGVADGESFELGLVGYAPEFDVERVPARLVVLRTLDGQECSWGFVEPRGGSDWSLPRVAFEVWVAGELRWSGEPEEALGGLELTY